MRELALHILDLVENSLRAGADTIAVTVEADAAADRLRIVVEDNGRGLKIAPEAAVDPFYTTKQGKRTGLGLALMKAAAEATEGRLTIGKSSLGPVGVTVTAEFGLGHVDRSPLGDLAGTLASLVCTNPGVEFRLALRSGEQGGRISTTDVARAAGLGPGEGLALAGAVRARVAQELARCVLLT
jgi:signal transduction histidine kinase